MKRRAHSRMDEIIERSLAGEATEAELSELAAWRGSAPANEEQYRRTERLLSAARALRARPAGVPPRPTATAILSAVGRSRRDARQSARLAAWAPWAVAAAAVIALVINIRAARPSTEWSPAEVVTGVTEMATVKLADGTVVRLAPSTRLQVDAQHTREVKLEGRAFFAVTPMPDQPFRVQTRAATANVLGTRFELSTEGDGLHLSVIEGRVALAAPENRVEVGAGEHSRVRHGAASPPTRIAAADGAVEPDWLGKFMVFQATPVRDVAREIERHYEVRVIIDPTLAESTITATFTDRPIDDVVGVVCAVLNARCNLQDGIVSLSR